MALRPLHPTPIHRIRAVAEHLPQGVRVPLLALLSLGLAACAAPAAQRGLVPVAVRVVAFPRASGTVETLARRPYLRVQSQAAEALLRARARVPGRSGSADPRARAAVALQRAREDYQGLRLPEALEGLAGALAELASAAALEAEDLRLLRELLLQRALCELALSRVVDAQASIAAAMALGFDGSQAGAYSPEVEAVIDGVRRQRVGGGHQALTVTARPADAVVLIDGRRVGPAPVTVKLGAGPHLLRAERRGFRPFARWWTAPASGGALQRLELVLETASVGATAAELLAGLHAAGDPSAGDGRPRTARAGGRPGAGHRHGHGASAPAQVPADLDRAPGEPRRRSAPAAVRTPPPWPAASDQRSIPWRRGNPSPRTRREPRWRGPSTGVGGSGPWWPRAAASPPSR
ncbi:MAG: PEGA domain-containing protein [Proteobacteria bacterium]|nr:PEGA domain-containing protein [Pseudomonadota bacterium]